MLIPFRIISVALRGVTFLSYPSCIEHRRNSFLVVSLRDSKLEAGPRLPVTLLIQKSASPALLVFALLNVLVAIFLSPL
jgi:hypothetical protein